MACQSVLDDLDKRPGKHELHLVNRHLGATKHQRVQAVTATDLAPVLRGMKRKYAAWTIIAVYRLVAGTFSLAVRRGVLTRSPVDGLAPTEIPKQRNKKQIARLDPAAMDKLVSAGTTERWRAELGLAGYGGLRLGEIRTQAWHDVDVDADTISVHRSRLPDGTAKGTKTEAGERTVPMLPALRRLLATWKLKSTRTRDYDLILCTADGAPLAERNLRRALEDAKTAVGMDGGEARLSWHSLRHGFASMLATQLELPATTLARLTGHSDPGFTLKVYARDGRDDQAVVADVLTRAATAELGV